MPAHIVNVEMPTNYMLLRYLQEQHWFNEKPEIASLKYKHAT